MPQPIPNIPTQDLTALIKQTNAGDPSAADLAALSRALIADNCFWRKAGDLSASARRAALKQLEPAVRESVILRAQAVQSELGYDWATMLERLLIEQVVTCWLHLELAQLIYGAAALAPADVRLMQALELRVAGAQRRYLRAMDALTRLRRAGGWASMQGLSAGRSPRLLEIAGADDEREDADAEDEDQDGEPESDTSKS